MSFDAMVPSLPKRFCGNWHKRPYEVLGELGRGANGTVYLAISQGRRLAVKVGPDPFDILMEANLLKSVSAARGMRIGPVLCDVDDVRLEGKSYTFYAMEYLEGERLDEYVRRVGSEWTAVLIVQLLFRLSVLHAQGWIFGDLKPENVIVVRLDRQVRLIDFGGVTKQGRAVRQFTEEYDRAYWQAGDRRAEAAYDLFSLAVLMIRLTLGTEGWKRLRTEKRHVQTLCDIIREHENLSPYRVPLVRALLGKYGSAEAMKQDMLAAIRDRTHAAPTGRGRGSAAGKWIGGLFVASLLLLAGSLYLVWM